MAGKKKSVKSKKKGEVKLTERKKSNIYEQIKELQHEISTTKYNKATQGAIGLLKAKLAMLKERATQRASVGKASGDTRFSVRKTGDATVILLGFPSVGKSTLLNKLTNAKSEIAKYAFTTLSAVPGLLNYKFAKIQIIDVPGIVSGAASGKGRGKEVIAMLRSADLILILVDALAPEHYKAILNEVYQSGIRINQQKPDVKITKKEKGGITIGTTTRLTKIDHTIITSIAKEMKLNNADILIREDIDDGQLIDCTTGDKIYTKALAVITKIDLIDKPTFEKIKKQIKPDLVVSAEKEYNIGKLKDAIYNKMGFIRIFLKEANKKADMEEPLIMTKGSTIHDVCNKLHRDFIDKFKFARLWGPSAKFDGQVFRKLNKGLADKDILELHMR